MAEFSTSCRVSSQSHSGPLAGPLYNLIQDLFQELFIITRTFAGFIFNYPGPHAEPLCNPIKLLLQGLFITSSRAFCRASVTSSMGSCRAFLLSHPVPLYNIVQVLLQGPLWPKPGPLSVLYNLIQFLFLTLSKATCRAPLKPDIGPLLSHPGPLQHFPGPLAGPI